MKKILAIILCLATVLSLCACTSLKKYTFDGFSVKLPKTFVPTEDTPYTAHLRDGDVFVWAIKDDFVNLSGSELWSEEEYANTLYQLNESKNPTPVTEERGVIYFEYNAFSEAKRKTFTYFTTMYKANDAFYMVQFVCEDAEYESYKPKFIEWAKTVDVK